MGQALALLLILITSISCYLFWSRTWWFPIDIARHGPAVDHQFLLTLIVTGVAFVAVQLVLAWAVWKYRARRATRRASYSLGNKYIEASWAVIATVLLIGLNTLGYRTWANIHFVGAQPGAMQIEVWGQQFFWFFRYPGPDGTFGPVHAERVNDAMGNYLGLDREHDAASRDDIITTTLAFPANREIQLILRSKDVTHSFFVRELRLKQDLVPGMQIPIHFTATRTGHYELACAELCGMGHYKMRAPVEVMTQEDFDKWLATAAAGQ
jgi:cytochrome c oxidase subunit 2